MSRFLLIEPDGETIAAVLSMNEADAMVNVGAGQTLVAIGAEADPGTRIDNGSVKYVDGALVDAVSGDPIEPLSDMVLTVLS